MRFGGEMIGVSTASEQLTCSLQARAGLFRLYSKVVLHNGTSESMSGRSILGLYDHIAVKRLSLS